MEQERKGVIVEGRWRVTDQEAAIRLILALDGMASQHLSEIAGVLVTVDGEVIRRGGTE